MKGLDMEKVIEGFDGKYLVSDSGKVFSLHKGIKRERKPVTKDTGYQKMSLRHDGKEHQIPLHRLVAKAFITNPENKRCVNHKDGNKKNNNVSNLEWVTHGENKHHSFKVLGEVHWLKDKHGALCPFHKKVEQVSIETGSVVRAYAGASEAARLNGYSQGTISMACRGERKTAYGFFWRYLENGTSNNSN
jgi:uncharacterized protein (UPF0248 family)